MYFVEPMMLSFLHKFRLHSSPVSNPFKELYSPPLTQLSIFHEFAYGYLSMSLESMSYSTSLQSFQKIVPPNRITTTWFVGCAYNHHAPSILFKMNNQYPKPIVAETFQSVVPCNHLEVIKSSQVNPNLSLKAPKTAK